MVIAGTLELLVGFYLATWMSPLFTSAALDAGFAMPENALSITSIGDGFLWPPALFAQLVNYLGVFGLVIVAALLGVAMFFYIKNSNAWEVAAGAPSETAADAPK
jgi:PTS system galactitol-specific IIC component